jgi:uncharacterized protein (DUF1501 family)
MPRPDHPTLPAAAGHCRDYTRSQLLHGVALAGAGLPAIERGMPTPAGSGLSRRSFLFRSAGLAVTVFGAKALAPAGYDEGLEAAMAAAGNDRVLVSISLGGGLDGLSVLAPVRDRRYTTLRPGIAVPVSDNPDDVFTDDDRLQWHPSAEKMRILHREGKVSVLPAVGYDHPDQSHFTSRHYWEVGETNARNYLGWLGRYLDHHGAPDNPLQGLSIGYSLVPSLAPAQVPVATLADPTVYSFWAENVGKPGMIDEGVRSLGRIGTPQPDDDEETTSARRAIGQMSRLQTTLAPLQGLRYPFSSEVTYPASSNAFPSKMAMIAEMLGRGLPLRCVATGGSAGYDTHDNHAMTMKGTLKLDMETIYAFQRDLEARGLADRVLIHVWSEFGRRVPENGPDGCDHGAGGISFVIGSNVQGQMIGEFPGLDVLDPFDNLRATSDFRGLYCSMLEQWFGVDAGPIIPGADRFARVPVIKAA